MSGSRYGHGCWGETPVGKASPGLNYDCTRCKELVDILDRLNNICSSNCKDP